MMKNQAPSLFQLKKLSLFLEEKLKGTSFISFKELSEGKWILETAKESFSYLILICLKAPWIRLHLLSKKPPTQKTPFSQKISSFLQGSSLSSLSLVNEDRILSFSFTHHFLIIELFPKGANLYLTDPSYTILTSFIPQTKTLYLPPQKPFKKNLSEEAPLPALEEWESFFSAKEKRWEFLQEKQTLEKKISSLLKQSKKLLQRLLVETHYNEELLKKEEEALLLQSYFHLLKKKMTSIELFDWKREERITIPLDPSLEPKEELAKRFSLCHKAKKRKIHLEKNITKAKEDLAKYQNALIFLQGIEDEESLSFFSQKIFPHREKITPKKEKKESKVRRFTTEEGLAILVGKSDKENELVSFSLAKGSDLWLHVGDFSGAHVIIQTRKNQQPSQESLLDGAHLALYFSKAREKKEGEVLITHCKYLKRVKGKPGKVFVGKGRRLFIRLDPKRLERLLFRKL